MRKDFLEDYMAREQERYESYAKAFLKSDKPRRYPDASRFPKLQEPLVYYDPSCYASNRQKLWSQIPFSGTTIISLRNVRKENFLQVHGFEISDIPRLIELAKDQGKVQFGFQSDLVLYEGLDYLDTIFAELQPPALKSIPISKLLGKESSDSSDAEFLKLARFGYAEWVRRTCAAYGEGENLYYNFMSKRLLAFRQMKILKMNDLIERISINMRTAPFFADYLFNQFLLFINPKFDALTPNVNIGLAQLNAFGNSLNNLTEGVRIPEVGNFIMEKMLLYPSSYHTCMDVITHYSDHELYKVMTALQEAIQHQKKDQTYSNIEELKVVLDNAWIDGSKLKGKSATIRRGISVVMGLCGGLLASDSSVGLLSAIGFNIAESMTSSRSLSNKIIRKLNPNYLVNIYDFQQKIPKKD